MCAVEELKRYIVLDDRDEAERITLCDDCYQDRSPVPGELEELDPIPRWQQYDEECDGCGQTFQELNGLEEDDFSL